MAKKSQVTWTDAEIKILYQFGNIYLIHDLQKLLPRHTSLAISVKRKRLGINLSENYISQKCKYQRSLMDNDILCKGNQKLVLSDLPTDVKQILLGSILGDGCIKMNSCLSSRSKARNYIFYEGHTRAQTEYVKWKSEKLKILNTTFTNTDDGNKPQMWTTSYPMLTELRKKIYGDTQISNKTYIPIDVFSQLDLFGFLIWYLDDGYNGEYVADIGCKSWNDFDLQAMVDHLNSNFSLSLSINKSRHMGGINKRIRFSSALKKHIFSMWRELFDFHNIPECMSYKLKHRYKKICPEIYVGSRFF